MGTGPDTPLAEIWTDGRALRIADGPDEVHLRSVAHLELNASRARSGKMGAYLTPPR
jgi:acyl-CoA dehydrogenase